MCSAIPAASVLACTLHLAVLCYLLRQQICQMHCQATDKQEAFQSDCREASYHDAQFLMCTILRCLTEVFVDGKSSSLAVFIAKVRLCQVYTSQMSHA